MVVRQVPPSICGSAQRMFILVDAENLVDASSVGVIVSPVRSTYGGYYGLVVVTPRPQTLHRSHDNLKNPYRIASIFYM